MNGILLINKPIGLTSHDVVFRLRKVFHIKRIGHLGTLDPLASGLLVVCVGDATKLVPFLENHDKTYLAEVKLGFSTTTYDLEGEITKQVPVPHLSEEEIDLALTKFLGEIEQIPPLYSAIKINGKKLYQYARSGVDVTIPKRKVIIHSLKRVSGITYQDQELTFSFQACVSKGTYIRSLCVDISESLGYPGVMTGLERTNSGPFQLDHAYTLTDIETGNFQMISMLDALVDWPKEEINEAIYQKVKNGQSLIPSEVTNQAEELIIVYQNQLIGIYQWDPQKKYYKAVRIWI